MTKYRGTCNPDVGPPRKVANLWLRKHWIASFRVSIVDSNTKPRGTDMYKLLFAMVLLLGVSPVVAQTESPVSEFCDADSAGCRELAVELARIEVLHRLSAAGGAPGELVCSPDNASLMAPFCAVAERVLINASLIEVAPDIDWGDWSWTDHCWRPLGCDGEIEIPEVVIPDPDPPGAICEIVDQGPGKIWICWAPGTFGRDAPPPPPRSPSSPELVRHLNDNAVRLDAAKAARDELTKTLMALEEEIRVLTP